MAEVRAQLKSAGGDVSGRHVRSARSLPIFASFVTFAFFAVTLAPPPANSSYASTAAVSYGSDSQSVAVAGEYVLTAERDAYSTSTVRVAPTAPAVGIPDAGTAQAIALELVTARGWDMTEYSCLVALWNRESNWNIYAHNS
ncbi:MAG: hypothetical protein Q8M65_04405, partial [Rhodoglobus sp.]|nr:hypothetical protein [Rhodoglobus sp.]